MTRRGRFLTVAMLVAISRGPGVELKLRPLRKSVVAAGFRNRDILPLLFPGEPPDPDARRRASARVTRLLRLLRAHGVIDKLEGTHRYVVTPSGNNAIAAVLAASKASLSRLQQCA